MARKLIHLLDGRANLHCDACGYDLPQGTVTWGSHLIGYECPKCAANMLTRRDYDDSERIFRWIAWINKWFGWLGTEPDDPRNGTLRARNHNGRLHIEDPLDQYLHDHADAAEGKWRERHCKICDGECGQCGGPCE